MGLPTSYSVFLLVLFLITRTDAAGRYCSGYGSPDAPIYVPSPDTPSNPEKPYTPSHPVAPSPCKHYKPHPSEFINEKQYKAYLVIQRFKRTITCDPMGITKTWVGPRPCNYTGFRCEDPPNAPHTPTIASVDFNGFALEAPTICGFIDELPDLAIFHVNSNNFSGTVPKLCKLPFLYELDLSNNKLCGSFPTEALTGIPQLQFLDLRYNFFTGHVPQSVFSAPLSVLFLNNNPFRGGKLPENLGNTTSKYLTLANNGLTGSIPRSIRNAADTLVEVLLLNNSLSGCLPYEIGYLKKATVFDAGTNQITGTIPKSFGCLKKVEQLNLANNLLYGEVPEVACRLHHLKNLSLSGNYFTSLCHACYSLMKQGKLDAKNNCILGLTNQRSPEECRAFGCKPKSCPKMNVVPCKLPHYAVPPPNFPPPKSSHGGAQAPSPSYHALHRHN